MASWEDSWPCNDYPSPPSQPLNPSETPSDGASGFPCSTCQAAYYITQGSCDLDTPACGCTGCLMPTLPLCAPEAPCVCLPQASPACISLHHCVPGSLLRSPVYLVGISPPSVLLGCKPSAESHPHALSSHSTLSLSLLPPPSTYCFPPSAAVSITVGAPWKQSLCLVGFLCVQ